MNSQVKPTIVIVPGLRDDMPEHWQSILATEIPGSVTVPRLKADKLSCGTWVSLLDATLSGVRGPVILVAHSGGVMIVAHWAQRHHRAIHGALLATPADLESPLPAGYPTREALADGGWLPLPRQRLPFPSIVAASTNDPLCSYERAAEFANTWGSRVVSLGAVGHLNPPAGYGRWAGAHDLMRELGASIAATPESVK